MRGPRVLRETDDPEERFEIGERVDRLFVYSGEHVLGFA